MEFEKTIDLPSCGLLEDSQKTLQIGSMDMRTEKVIYTRALATEKLLKIVGMCSDAKPDALKKFPFADLVYSFIRIRVQSTGSPEYSFRIQCSMCGEAFTEKANFDEMEVKFLEELDDGGDLEPFSIDLPVSQKEVHLKYLRASDHLAMEKMQRKRKAKGLVSDERFLCETLARRTVLVDGKEAREAQTVQFYESLKTQDGYRIKDAIEERDFGISMLVDGECPHCGEMDEYLVKMDATFFRPQPGGAEEAS